MRRSADDDLPEGVTPFQAVVAQTFFELPESRDFLLAGGAALLALRLSRRLTEDLDFFTSGHTVEQARDALSRAAMDRGWAVVLERDIATHARLTVGNTDGEVVRVDFCVDAPPLRAPSSTALGPTYDPEELAGHKVLALFDRAAARDFVDVYVLAERFGTVSIR